MRECTFVQEALIDCRAQRDSYNSVAPFLSSHDVKFLLCCALMCVLNDYKFFPIPKVMIFQTALAFSKQHILS